MWGRRNNARNGVYSSHPGSYSTSLGRGGTHRESRRLQVSSDASHILIQTSPNQGSKIRDLRSKHAEPHVESGSQGEPLFEDSPRAVMNADLNEDQHTAADKESGVVSDDILFLDLGISSDSECEDDLPDLFTSVDTCENDSLANFSPSVNACNSLSASSPSGEAVSTVNDAKPALYHTGDCPALASTRSLHYAARREEGYPSTHHGVDLKQEESEETNVTSADDFNCGTTKETCVNDESPLPSIKPISSRFSCHDETVTQSGTTTQGGDAISSTSHLSTDCPSVNRATKGVVIKDDLSSTTKTDLLQEACSESEERGGLVGLSDTEVGCLPDLPDRSSIASMATNPSNDHTRCISESSGINGTDSQECGLWPPLPDWNSSGKNDDFLGDFQCSSGTASDDGRSDKSSNLADLPDLDCACSGNSVMPDDSLNKSEPKCSEELRDMPTFVINGKHSDASVSETTAQLEQHSCPNDKLSDTSSGGESGTTRGSSIVGESSPCDSVESSGSSVLLKHSIKITYDSDSDSKMIIDDQLPVLSKKRKRKRCSKSSRQRSGEAGVHSLSGDRIIGDDDEDDVIITKVQDKPSRMAKPRLKPEIVDLTFDSDSDMSDVLSLDAWGGENPSTSLLSSLYADNTSDSSSVGDIDKVPPTAIDPHDSTAAVTVISPSDKSSSSVIDPCLATVICNPSSGHQGSAVSRSGVSPDELQCAINSISHPLPPSSPQLNMCTTTAKPVVSPPRGAIKRPVGSVDQDCLIIDTSMPMITPLSRKRPLPKKQSSVTGSSLYDSPLIQVRLSPPSKQRQPPKKRHGAADEALPTVTASLESRKKVGRRRKGRPVVSSGPTPGSSAPAVIHQSSVLPTTPLDTQPSALPPPSAPSQTSAPPPPYVPPLPSALHTPSVQSPPSAPPLPFAHVSTLFNAAAMTIPLPSLPDHPNGLPYSFPAGLTSSSVGMQNPSRQFMQDDLHEFRIKNLVNYLQADVTNFKAIRCDRCEVSCLPAEIILCPFQHQCCKRCLEAMVKKILIAPYKERVRCPVADCDVPYTSDKLRMCLQPVLFEVLEQKLEQEPDTCPQTNVPSQVSSNPSFWEDMPDVSTFMYVQLDKNDVEFKECAASFHTSMLYPRAQISNIYRVQNRFQWRLYSLMKEKMRTEQGVDPLEKKLFHGTNVAAVSKISESGFDWRLSGLHGSVYGDGSYFACAASYSHRYSPPSDFIPHLHLGDMLLRDFQNPAPIVPQTRHVCGDQRDTLMQNMATEHMINVSSQIPYKSPHDVLYPLYYSKSNKTHLMFRVSVLVGHYARGSSGMRRPPPVNSRDPYGPAFDSCVDDVIRPTIHVVFEHGKAYAEHVIEYTNEVATWGR